MFKLHLHCIFNVPSKFLLCLPNLQMWGFVAQSSQRSLYILCAHFNWMCCLCICSIDVIHIRRGDVHQTQRIDCPRAGWISMQFLLAQAQILCLQKKIILVKFHLKPKNNGDNGYSFDCPIRSYLNNILSAFHLFFLADNG